MNAQMVVVTLLFTAAAREIKERARDDSRSACVRTRKEFLMSTATNKAIVRDYVQKVWNEQRVDLVDEFMAEDFFHHDALGITNREDVRNFITMTLNAFPDFKVTIEHQVSEGDLVVHRQTISGTQNGEYLGIPATGKSFSALGIYIFRMKDGKIAELWGVADALGMMQQLGAIPAPETSEA